MTKIFNENKGRYGYRRITALFLNCKVKCNTCLFDLYF
ncbi:MAG: transposase [Clostridia bacterium]|nr:transposase [Clostridia bacterium]